MEVLIDRGVSAVVGKLKGILKHVDDVKNIPPKEVPEVPDVDTPPKDVPDADDVVDESPKDTPDVGEDIGGGLDALSTPSSQVLRQNLIDAGVKVPDYPNAAHHIVAGNSPKAAEARAILQKYGIDINDAENGVFLPTAKDVTNSAYHPSLHTNAYYNEINKQLLKAKSKDDVLSILEDIAEQLTDGTFMK